MSLRSKLYAPITVSMEAAEEEVASEVEVEETDETETESDAAEVAAEDETASEAEASDESDETEAESDSESESEAEVTDDASAEEEAGADESEETPDESAEEVEATDEMDVSDDAGEAETEEASEAESPEAEAEAAEVDDESGETEIAEDEAASDNDVVDSVSAEVLAINGLSEELEEDEGDIDSLEHAIASLESIAVIISDSIKTGGMDHNGTRMAEAAVGAVLSPLGVGNVVTSCEEFSGSQDKLGHSKTTLTKIKDTLKALWKAFLEALSNLGQRILDGIKKLLDVSTYQIPRFKERLRQVKEMSGSPKASTFTDGSLASAFMIEETVNLTVPNFEKLIAITQYAGTEYTGQVAGYVKDYSNDLGSFKFATAEEVQASAAKIAERLKGAPEFKDAKDTSAAGEDTYKVLANAGLSVTATDYYLGNVRVVQAVLGDSLKSAETKEVLVAGQKIACDLNRLQKPAPAEYAFKVMAQKELQSLTETGLKFFEASSKAGIKDQFKTANDLLQKATKQLQASSDSVKEIDKASETSLKRVMSATRAISKLLKSPALDLQAHASKVTISVGGYVDKCLAQYGSETGSAKV